MDITPSRRSGLPFSSLIDLPEFIINSFLPSAQPFLAKYPRLFRSLGFLLGFWYLRPITRLQAIWSQISSLVVASVSISSEEDLFGYMLTYLYERKTLRPDQKLNAISNPIQEPAFTKRSGRDIPEENSKNIKQAPKIKYERVRGTEFFIHKRRLFWASRAEGEGHQYIGNRYKHSESLSISCLGRSTEPIKQLLEDVYCTNKDKEKTRTIIRRPYNNGYSSRVSWSRLTSKPRRALNTVILDATLKSAVITDIEEYLHQSTASFYGSHGIPYRRGYMFYGPPGTGKTSFALALASKFDMDVYILSLLDQDLSDSDLISLLNQLPCRSLLLLEDIDTAGLSKRKSISTPSGASHRAFEAPLSRLAAARGGRQKSKNDSKSKRTIDSGKNREDDNDDKDNDDIDDDENANGKPLCSRVTLSGLLNAIDGVAAPEGHILIITTNQPYKLDDALVRAGRISVRVAFTNATKAQSQEIFNHMYKTSPTSASDHSHEVGAGTNTRHSTSNIDLLASKFAITLPDQEYSPADLQDYLLIHKKDPDSAVAQLPKWIATQNEERAQHKADYEFDICPRNSS